MDGKGENITPPPATNNRRRFTFFCGEWLRQEKGMVKDSAYVKYDTILRKHTLPKLGGCFPLGISTQLVERFKQERRDGELSVKTIRDILTVLRSILKYAAGQYPGWFPAVEISCPKEQKKRPVSSLGRDRDSLSPASGRIWMRTGLVSCLPCSPACGLGSCAPCGGKMFR